MKGKIILTLILFIHIVFLTGCWNSRELNNLSIAIGLGIDKSEEGYLVTVQLINPSEIASKMPSSRTAVTTYRTTGSTVFEALRKLTQETPRKIYLSHIRILVFGEELAREGIAKPLDFISRDHEFRTDFYILVAKGTKATEVLNVLTPLEKIPANKVYSSIEMSAKAWAATYHIQLDELITKLVSKGDNPVLTGVYIKGDAEIGMDISNAEKIDSPTILNIDSMAIFKKDKMIGWLDPTESEAFNYISGKVKSTVIVIPWSDGGRIGIEVIRTKSKVKSRVEEEEPQIDVEYFLEANVGEVEANVDLSKPESIHEIEKILENQLKNEMEGSVKKVQKDFKSDIFGFGEAIHRGEPKAWKELQKDWNKEFEDLEVNVKVTARIRRTGTITKAYQEEAGE